MWEETLIESRRTNGTAAKWVTFPLALLFHGLLMAVTVVTSYTFIHQISPRPIRITFFSSPPPVSASPAPRKKTYTGEDLKDMERKAPPPLVQPTEIPMDILEPADTGKGDEGLDSEEGDPDVVLAEGGIFEGGYPAGLVMGVPDGVVMLPGAYMGEAAPLRVTGEMKRPQKIRTAKPDYPREAQSNHIEGVVVLKAIINERGGVEDVIVVQSLHPLLDQSAMEAIRQWKYRPAYLQSQPVRVFLTVIVQFALDYRGTAELW